MLNKQKNTFIVNPGDRFFPWGVAIRETRMIFFSNLDNKNSIIKIVCLFFFCSAIEAQN